MPYTKLTDETRRAVVLAALRGESVTKVAREYGIHRNRVYQLADEARAKAEAEAPYWREVAELARD